MTDSNYRVCSAKTWTHAFKIAIVEDRPIMLDYWTASLEKKVLIGIKNDGEKLLVKSDEEYTSPIAKIFQVEKEFIILTENSLYITSSEIDKRQIA